MINTFRDIFYGYVAALALGLVLTIRVLNPALPSGLRLGLFIVIILVAAGIATWLTQKRILSCNEPVENCRLREGIDRLEGIMKTVRDHNSRVMFKLNEAAAYIDLGEYSRAVEIMKDANVPDKHSLREMTLMAIYQYQMAVALMETGLLDEAELRVTTLDYILGDLKFREPMLSRMLRSSKMAKQRLAVLRGDHEGAYDAYRRFEENAESLRVRVCCRYRMGEESAYLGNMKDAVSSMEYVAKYGGDTVYAAKAREFLAEQKKAGGEE